MYRNYVTLCSSADAITCGEFGGSGSESLWRVVLYLTLALLGHGVVVCLWICNDLLGECSVSHTH